MDYEKLIKDFNNGTIDPDKWTLMMDNDCGYWRRTGDDVPIDEDGYLDESFLDRESHKMEKLYGEPGGYGDIVDILNAAGVNTEWC